MEKAYVNTEDSILNVKTVVEKAYVNTEDSDITVKTVNGFYNQERQTPKLVSSLTALMRTLHNNKVGVVFAKHTRVVVFFVEVDEHENMSVLLVTHDVIIDFDELFWTHLTCHLLSYEI